MASCLFPGGGHRRRRVRRARHSLWIVRLAAHWRPGWEPARLLTGMVNQAQRAGWRPLGNVQCGRPTQENREVPWGMCSAGARPRKTGRSWSSKWVGVPMGTTARNTNGTPRFPALGRADAPGSGWRGFLSLPSRQLKPPLGAPHASPQLPLSRRYPGPLLGYPFDRDVHSRRSRLFEWALGWGVAFASPPGGDSLQSPASAITCCARSVAGSRRPLASLSLRGKGGFEAPLHLSWRPQPLAPGHCPACGFRRLLPPSTKPRSNKSYRGGWGIKSRLATSRVGNRGGLRPARPLPPE